MEILLWLVPPALVTVLAMAWAGWRGREPRQEQTRDEAVRRLGEALNRPVSQTSRWAVWPTRSGRGRGQGQVSAPPDPSTGVAVRPSRRSSGRFPE